MTNGALDHTQLRTLAAILRTGSFEAAAGVLGITQSAVSQRLRALEDRVGTALVIRGNPARATETGQRLFAHAEQIALLDAALARDLGTSAGPPSLRIAVNADSLATWFLPALAAAGDIRFQIIIDDQDHSADLLRRGEVMAAVTAHGAPVQGCDTRALGALRYRATASPAFAARWFPDGVTPAALRTAPALIYDEKDALQAVWAEGLTGERLSGPSHRLPSTTAFVEAARLGLGWGMNPEPLVADLIAAGELIDLAPDRPHETPLYWQSSRIGKAALAPLTRAVRRAAKTVLIDRVEPR